MQLSEVNRPKARGLLSYVLWVIPLLPLEAAVLQSSGTTWDNFLVIVFLLIPQWLMLTLLRVFRARVPVLVGAAIALASQTVMSWLVVWYAPPGGQWWWVCILTMPGALIGTLFVLAYVMRVRNASPAIDATRSFLLLGSSIAINAIICLIV